MRIRTDPLDKLASEVVRRKSGGYCERCGKYFGWKGLQCCHFINRRKKATRYDLENLVAMDFGCHQYFDENKDEFEIFMVNKLGQERLDMLKSRGRILARYIDKEAIKLCLEEELRGLNED